MIKRARANSPLISRRTQLLGMASILTGAALGVGRAGAEEGGVQAIALSADGPGKLFEGMGVVNGGGATSVLLKDYPEPQRSQILDLVYKPKFGASVSALMVEIPGDGNSTQGSMPSHMRTRDDLDFTRGYTWWVISEAKKRNPKLSLDGAAWSAPGWLGGGDFWSQDTADYYVKWLEGLRAVYGIELDAIGCRNEKGYDYPFAIALRKTLDRGGFDRVRLHAFDHWPNDKLNFVKDMMTDKALADAIDILGAHVFHANSPATPEVQAMAEHLGKPIWNTEEHVYKKGFDCAISIVRSFNDNYIRSGATRVVNWYDIGGVYPMQPYPEDPATILAWQPWSGHYEVREALWGYAHWGQFTEVGWRYLDGGCAELLGGGSVVSLASTQGDYSLIVETRDAKGPQTLRVSIGAGLSGKPLCVWKSNVAAQFVRQADVTPADGVVTLQIEPDTIYSLSTTTGQRKGGFDDIPAARPFPFPYYETFETYAPPRAHGHLPRYTADIAGVFELADRPDGKGRCLRQVIPAPTNSWAPDWLPYTILGDRDWGDYEVSCDVWLSPGDTAAVMGRVNHVGTGWGFIPKGYFLELTDGGKVRLVAIRGKKDPRAITGDAEQQALIRAGKFDGEGGELVLGEAAVPAVKAGRWIKVALRFEGAKITGLIDGKPVLTATSPLYERGMAGLLAGGDKTRLSRPWFDNLLIRPVGARTPKPAAAGRGQTPIYAV
jgi:galactosylceramidase